MLKDPDDPDFEVVLSGQQNMDEAELALVTKLAPACVWTTYTQEDQ